MVDSLFYLPEYRKWYEFPFLHSKPYADNSIMYIQIRFKNDHMNSSSAGKMVLAVYRRRFKLGNTTEILL